MRISSAFPKFTVHAVVLAAASCVLGGCYKELPAQSQAPTPPATPVAQANSAQQPKPSQGPGAIGLGNQPASSALGKAKQSAANTIDKAQQQSQDIADHADDPLGPRKSSDPESKPNPNPD